MARPTAEKRASPSKLTAHRGQFATKTASARLEVEATTGVGPVEGDALVALEPRGVVGVAERRGHREGARRDGEGTVVAVWSTGFMCHRLRLARRRFSSRPAEGIERRDGGEAGSPRARRTPRRGATSVVVVDRVNIDRAVRARGRVWRDRGGNAHREKPIPTEIFSHGAFRAGRMRFTCILRCSHARAVLEKACVIFRVRSRFRQARPVDDTAAGHVRAKLH